MAFKFEYSEHMKQYRKDNNISNTIVAINPLTFKQLKHKYPKFTVDIMSDYGIISHIINVKKVSDDTYTVLDGYGQLTGGTISVVRE